MAAVGHKQIVELIDDGEQQALVNKATGEIKWLPAAPWSLGFHGEWGFLHAVGKESQWVANLMKKKLMKEADGKIIIMEDGRRYDFQELQVKHEASFMQLGQVMVRISCFELPVDAARVFVEYRLVQKYVCQDSDERVLVTRQHQLWDRQIQQCKVLGIPEGHWRKGAARGQGGGSESHAHRCLDNAAFSCWAMVMQLVMWAARALKQSVKSWAMKLLDEILAVHLADTVVEISMDLNASAPPPGWSTAARRHRLSVSSAVPPRMGGEAPGGHRGSSYGTPAGTHGSLVKRP